MHTPPKHIAFIMDGNGRFAKKHDLSTIKGHENGAEVMKDIVAACVRQGIAFATFYAFSTENWSRPKFWIDQYFRLANHYLEKQTHIFLENKVRVKAIGDVMQLPASTRDLLCKLEEQTGHFKGTQVNIALAYGSRNEMMRATQKIAEKVQRGEILPGDITEQTLQDHLDTKGIPDVDILIRTSGEQRLSNYLLFQMAYAELYFTRTLWPEFSEDELVHILQDFSKRDRRYGNYVDFKAL